MRNNYTLNRHKASFELFGDTMYLYLARCSQQINNFDIRHAF